MTATVIRGMENLFSKNRDSRFWSLGIRFDRADTAKELFVELENSIDLSETETHGEELDGTCALYLSLSGNDPDDITEQINEALEEDHYEYDYSHVYVIAGNNAYDGMDPHETVISNAYVLAELSLVGK